MNAISPQGNNRELTPEEVAEVDRHKYFLSEKAGYDVGWEHALEDWMSEHRSSVDASGEAESAPERGSGFGSILKRFFSKAASL